MEASVGAAGALLAYLEEGWPQALATLRPPRAVRGAGHVYLDHADPPQPRPLRGRTTARRLARGDPRPHAHRDGRAAPARAPRPTAPERRGGRGASRRGGSLRQHDARPLRCAGGAQGPPRPGAPARPRALRQRRRAAPAPARPGPRAAAHPPLAGNRGRRPAPHHRRGARLAARRSRRRSPR